ncbi:Rho1 guanine nucleotide exchange factor 1 [Coccidioides immitis H538.4]|uniref:Rho1 guanine nucleotide exchange factor 1 n=1 Tax=Coccidioides immitis H538.4 TaxID=396776 RepID=A0A0J8RMP0_COCIT|nr:Rho1 guanine nucleotide exchange factor 1 [Coccidioides immitis H538.4]
MSLSSYTSDRDHAQTISSGRVIPNRRRDSGMERDRADRMDRRPMERPPSDQIPGLPEITPPHDPHSRIRHPSESSINSRTLSMASTVAADRNNSLQTPNSVKSGHSAPATVTAHRSRTPLVYPALLSRVAAVFKERVSIGERIKNDLAYTNAFTGAEAVDLLSYIIKTTDRNLALLLGRALDAQKFFHDVTYDHRLRDAPGELYQFRETMGEESPISEVNGVFTLLTECYSPTCTRDQLCYSIACPRRLEQQARLNLKPHPGLRTSASRGSLHDQDESEDQKLWINMVPKEVADSIDDREKKRQEIIFEVMYTERDFVKDLEYLRDFWMRPLRSAHNTNLSPVPEHRREKFIRTVFGNVLEVLSVNSRFSEALNARQKESHVVHSIPLVAGECCQVHERR